MGHFSKRALWLAMPLVLTLAAAGPAARPAGNLEITPPAEKKFSGIVKEVKQRRCVICNCIELSVVLKTDHGRLEARLGPKPFFEEHDFVISRGDAIAVTGIRFNERGKDIVLANEVQKGGEALVLRGKFSKPAWLEAHGHTCPVCGN
jgi:hypothetical protein